MSSIMIKEHTPANPLTPMSPAELAMLTRWP